jgi:hypothetical protein
MLRLHFGIASPLTRVILAHNVCLAFCIAMTIEGRPKDGFVEAQVTLFNSIPYQIPMCRDYQGDWFAKGHHFDTRDWRVSEMRVEIASLDFDPASLG